MSKINQVWAQIIKHEGKLFKTKTGRVFSYRIENETIITQWHHQDKKRKHIIMGMHGYRLKKHHLEKSLQRMPIEKVTDLRDVFLYPSHLWGILNDPRILNKK